MTKRKLSVTEKNNRGQKFAGYAVVCDFDRYVSDVYPSRTAAEAHLEAAAEFGACSFPEGHRVVEMYYSYTGHKKRT